MDFKKAETRCREMSSITESFVDRFLLEYCADREGLEEQFISLLRPYRHLIARMPEQWPGMMLSQYIAHQLFSHDGCAASYASHPAITGRSSREIEFLNNAIDNPWRFTFCSIAGHFGDDFFEMTDISSGEAFILYSTGITAIMNEERPPALFFLLISNNGLCRQSYGPIAHFAGFTPNDLLYYAQAHGDEIEAIEDLNEHIEKRPVPWMALFADGGMPAVYNKDDMMQQVACEYTGIDLRPDDFHEAFTIRAKKPLYQLTLKRWGSFPHFATAYYHAKKKHLVLSAMTERGHEKLRDAVIKSGINLPGTRIHRVTPAMSHAIETITGKKVELCPYQDYFSSSSQNDAESSEELEKLNRFTNLLLEAYNKKKPMDIDAMANQAGIDSGTAYQIAGQVMQSLGKLAKQPLPKKRK